MKGLLFQASLSAQLGLACLGSVEAAQGQKAMPPPRVGGEHELSTTVWVTWVGETRNGVLDELTVAVLWRGKPYWHRHHLDVRSDEGGISERGVSSSDYQPVIRRTVYKFGEVELAVEINWSEMVARINGGTVDLRTANVVLVDRADTREPRVVKALQVRSKLVPGVDFDVEYTSLLRFLMNVPEIREFAR
jgi:hypothetical protein